MFPLPTIPGEDYCTRTLLPRLCEWDHDLEVEVGGGETTFAFARQQERAARLAMGVAMELWQRHPRPCDLVAALSDRMRDLEAVSDKPDPSFLLRHLVMVAPERAVDLALAAMATGGTQLANSFNVILYLVYESDPATAFTLCETALDSSTQNLRRSVAHFCQFGLQGNEPSSPTEIAIVRRLLDDADLFVRRAGLACLRWLGQFEPRQAIDWAIAMDLGDDSSALSELCQLASAVCNGVPDALTDTDIQAVLTKLMAVGDLDHPHVNFLRFAFERVPSLVLDMLIHRIYRASTDASTIAYTPIPFQGLDRVFETFRDDPRLFEYLRDIRDRASQARGIARMFFQDLYREVSLHYSDPGIEVLAEWIRTGDEHQLLAALDLLRHGPNNLVFERLPLISTALGRATDFGAECHRGIIARIVSLASGGMRSGPAGEPYPQDIALRDRCDKLLRTLTPGGRDYLLFTDIRQRAQSAIEKALAELEEEA